MVSVTTQLGYSTLPRQRIPRGPFVRGLKWFAAMVFWVVLGGLVVDGTTLAVAKGIGPLPAVFSPIGMILLLVAGAILARGVRRVRDLSVLHYLEQAVRVNAPLAGMLAAAERDERKSVRLRLRRLRTRLQAGDSVSVALAAAAPALPRRMTGLIAAGENTGCLGSAMRRVATRRDFLPMANPTNSIFSGWYPLVLLMICFAVVQRIAIFALPRYELMLRDFHVPIPTSTTLLRQFPEDLGSLIIACIGLVLSLFCGRMVSQIFTAHGVTLGPLRRATDALLWYTPVAGTMACSRGMADVCYTLANALDAGLLPEHAIVEAATASGNFILERRLRRWACEMLAGRGIAEAARVARLPALLREMLATAGNSSDLSETFRFLCRYYDGRFSRIATLLRNAVLPATAIGVGAIVLLVALSVFQPMVEFMNKLTSH